MRRGNIFLSLLFLAGAATVQSVNNPAAQAVGRSLFEKQLSVKPAILSGGWYAMHFRNGDIAFPVRDSVNKAGVFEITPEGLKVYASAYRVGGWLMQKAKMNFAGKTVYMKWKVDAQYDFSDIHAVFYPTIEPAPSFYKSWTLLSYLSTRNQWDESVGIPFTQDWYYTRIVFSKNKFVSCTSKYDYDNKGGTLIQEYRKNITTTVGHIGMSFNDVYAGPSAWFMLGEMKIAKK